jgi:hypothetical protein
MVIRFVVGEITVFEIDGKLYYFRDRRGLPELFDQNLTKLIAPNLDNWLQTMTGQRYSLRGLRDMSAAFTSGLQCGISEEQARQLISNAILESKNHIFQSALASDYARKYFIELIDPVKIEIAHLPTITKNFNKLLKTCGAAHLYNYLCRFWQLCNHHSVSTAAVFENLIRRLGKEPATPQYPITAELDNDLAAEVGRIVLKNVSLYNVTADIVHNIKKLT